jgi:hypothetical protein
VNNARVWGGLHYRNSTQVGETMGRQIGALAVKQILTPRSGHDLNSSREPSARTIVASELAANGQ